MTYPASPHRETASLLEAGLAAHRAADLDTAMRAYRQVLAVTPEDAAALNLLGTALLQTGELAEAAAHLERARRAQPRNPELLANLAQCFLRLGRHGEAAELFRRAARIAPENPNFETGLAAALALQGMLAEARTVLERLVKRFPAAPLAWFNLGNVLRDLKQGEAAIAAYDEALRLASDFADALNNRGSVLHASLRLSEAEAAYRRCIEIAPDLMLARYNLASVLIDLGRFSEAESVCRQMIARAPDTSQAYTILGAALGHQGRILEALACHAHALQLAPGDLQALEVYGGALVEIGRLMEGLRYLARVLAMAPERQSARRLLATLLLGAGMLQDGWNEYGVRPAATRFREKYPHMRLARTFGGENLVGQDVYLLREQGLGDEIFFLRFAAELARRGARVIYEPSDKIATLVERIAGIEMADPESSPASRDGIAMLLGDLPHALGALPQCARGVQESISAAVQPEYASSIALFWPHVPRSVSIEPLPERVAAMRERLGAAGPPPYIAVTWRAGTRPEEQTAVWTLHKEIAPEVLGTAMRGVRGTAIALQRTPQPGEIAAFSGALGAPVHDFCELNDELEDMLALLFLADEYVSVSNTNVHLRAAAGRTARVLVPVPPEWRWMLWGRSSLWFPGFTVYRQSFHGDWTEALAALRRDLARSASMASA